SGTSDMAGTADRLNLFTLSAFLLNFSTKPSGLASTTQRCFQQPNVKCIDLTPIHSFVIARAPSPAREARALPRMIQREYEACICARATTPAARRGSTR